jgi:hypothetical protein
MPNTQYVHFHEAELQLHNDDSHAADYICHMPSDSKFVALVHAQCTPSDEGQLIYRDGHQGAAFTPSDDGQLINGHQDDGGSLLMVPPADTAFANANFNSLEEDNCGSTNGDTPADAGSDDAGANPDHETWIVAPLFQGVPAEEPPIYLPDRQALEWFEREARRLEWFHRVLVYDHWNLAAGKFSICAPCYRWGHFMRLPGVLWLFGGMDEFPFERVRLPTTEQLKYLKDIIKHDVEHGAYPMSPHRPKNKCDFFPAAVYPMDMLGGHVLARALSTTFWSAVKARRRALENKSQAEQ